MSWMDKKYFTDHSKSTLTSFIHQAKSVIWSGFDFMSTKLTFWDQDASYLYIIYIKAKKLVIRWIHFI